MKESFDTDKISGDSAFEAKQRKKHLWAILCCAAAVGVYCLIAFWPRASAHPAPQAGSAAPSAVSSAALSGKAEKPAAEQVSLQNAAKPLWVQVSIAKQTVTVYDAKNRVVQQYKCSTGLEGDDTPTGTFTVSDRGESFYSEKYKEGAYYWTRFQGSFLFHSVPFDKSRKYEPEEAAKLGTRASHGCVRLATENAKWIYDNISSGTKVVIE